MRQGGFSALLQRGFESAGRYLLYATVLVAINFFSAVAAITPDADYKDAETMFQKRDLSSCLRSIQMLEKILEQKADHIDTQALLAYAYAHESFILAQIGQQGSEYANSAEAFAKAVLTQQPKNQYAAKAAILLALLNNKQDDVRKLLEKEVTDKEADPDLWYLLAVVSDGDKISKNLSKALSLRKDHVWIYSDMAFRAIKMSDLQVADKWIKALEAVRPGLGDTDLLQAVVAFQRKDTKNAQLFWDSFLRKTPEFSLTTTVPKPAKK